MRANRRDCDALIVGGGHNGLVCAAYLARAGLDVRVLERRPVLGGAAVTAEFHPGFRNSVAAYTVSLLHPRIVAELDLEAHGLSIVEREIENFLPLPNGASLSAARGRTAAEVAKFSARDAAELERYDARLDLLAGALRELMLERPPNLAAGGWRRALPELLRAVRLGRVLRGLTRAQRQELLTLFAASAGEYLDGWFESDPIKAVLGFESIVGHYAGPYSAGSAYGLLHHGIGGVNGKRRAWGHALGGMGAISDAMARSAAARGAELHVDAPVREILVERGRAVGAVTESGRTFRARAIVAGVNPKLLFLELVDAAVLDTDFLERIERYRCRSGTFRMNVALAELPDFSCLPGRTRAPHHTAGIIFAPSLRYMERAYVDARTQGWSNAPVIEMLIPSTLDDSLAPTGRHVASLFCQHAAPELPSGESWDSRRERFADLVIDTVDAYAPNFKRAVLGRQILSPLDLERTFGLVGGDIFHGELALDQLFSARPLLGHADYRGPLPGLYLCGSGTHPGGGVTGAPGHNAAREVIRDFRKRRVPA